eukprot:Phypoly_transcript_05706.p1 GENE.Phypoly_transcript_05706~~Phypoly_transcript_05706.p1  ORF type:complete len:594 (+),score=140.36 Phypoly_transcript_05706:52-1782(+)
MTALCPFAVPIIIDNDDGWGPPTGGVPSEKLAEIPYAPFSKSDKVGKSADWQGGQRNFSQNRYQNYGASAPFSYKFEEDDDDFVTVDKRTITKSQYPPRRKFTPNWQRGGRFGQQPGQRGGQPAYAQTVVGRGGKTSGGGREQQVLPRGGQGQRGGYQQRNWGGGRYQDGNRFGPKQRNRESSVEIKADWAVVEQIEFSQLQKASFTPPEPEELYAAGSVEYYNKQYTTLVAKTEKPLERVERQFFKITTTDDPIIRELTMKNRGTVFATDAILATLMAAPRSIYSWDIVIQRVGTKTFLDKRDNTQFDYLTVNETANDPPSDEKDPLNSPNALSQEATFINQNYSQQVLIKGGKKYEFGVSGEPKPNPFASSEGSSVPLGSVGYRYRKWQLGDHALVARTEVDAVLDDKGTDVFILVKALNEYDTKAVDWRKKVDAQRGSVLATELKNNSNKVAKWTAQAVLAGAEQLNLGYVSRANAKDSYNHVILGAQTIQVAAFAKQITLSEKNMWGILKFFFDMFAKLDTGKYVLVKDPNKSVIRLYSVPPDAFDDLGGESTSVPQEESQPSEAAEEESEQ